MPRVRLTGLILFITAIFLGLASAATQTSHLRFKRPEFSSTEIDAENAASEDFEGQPPIALPPDADPSAELANQEAQSASLHFISVPMLYPLTGVGLLGLALWFVPGGIEEATRSGNRSSRKGRGATSKRRASTKGLSMLAARNARRKRR
ncbi:MAG: hypothetical protein ACE361_04720 [Aureliella sp.]